MTQLKANIKLAFDSESIHPHPKVRKEIKKIDRSLAGYKWCPDCERDVDNIEHHKKKHNWPQTVLDKDPYYIRVKERLEKVS